MVSARPPVTRMDLIIAEVEKMREEQSYGK
jgi:hypothetical protein